ncbi:T9SS type B sorting domain-containing protein [Adhaeribacter radiodurans]|uniref:Gliding motility-associated C-terminal domain-containing protein n=1 Tax=Adhaeribacter radiodurans TaxID=2745197 RepID=A0A7L7LF13_9BACT|nr:gliding motility-associated C-terminal domain-containing protein [Adhaeribacter radiodurans]QMU31274.1 gliding motility-associated C-terminal domain-containing protein [Adhaeribacter radiodurans]
MLPLKLIARKVYLLITLVLLAVPGYAQNEATIWYLGNGYGLDFKQGSPEIINAGTEEGFSTYTYSNTAGQVLLSANQQGIFNKNNILISNGSWNINSQSEIYIIRKPTSRTLFYIFYVGYISVSSEQYSEANNAVMYTLVDITGNNGSGAILEKDKVIYSNLHGSFTVSALCANNTYWLVGETNTNVQTEIGTDLFLAYKITPDGIATTPVRSEPVSIGNSSDLKFSPQGDKIVFGYDGNPGYEGTGIADFNPETGKLAKSFRLEARGWEAEFSTSGKKLYLNDLYQNTRKMWQFDLSSTDASEILASKILVYSGSINLGFSQLAPDGKIYLTQPDNNTALAVINYPERAGIACAVIPNALVLPKEITGHLPTFAANFLAEYSFKPNAGPDQAVCQNQSVTLGGTNNQQYTYRWEPTNYLSDPTSPTPVFQYADTITKKLDLNYILYVNDGNCERVDEVVISVLPVPEKSLIKGSQSVCPGVELVDYTVVTQPGYRYQWSVVGGQLVSGQGSGAIKVTWGPTNPRAQVKVTVLNEFGCASIATILPVRINVELKPETPQGLELICLNQSAKNQYTVIYTTGSVYTWGIKGGLITTGQGTNSVSVDWLGLGEHKIWIQEKSTTVDTVCFGVSDTLRVNVFKDNTALVMQNVSVSLADEKQVEITWTSSDADRLQGPLTLQRRPLGTATWTFVSNPNNFTFTDSGINTDAGSYEYQVSGFNGCNEPITSNPHHTIQLKAEALENKAKITLTWNGYDGWPDGVERYEIWRQLDEEADLKQVVQVNPSNLTFAELSSTAGFTHQYRIKAIARNSTFISWSNPINLSFSHVPIIPNIITPNGDGRNDFFTIRYIELYPDNQITIYNRWGQPVWQKDRYDNSWSAADLTIGTYYYTLLLRKTGKQIKGWIEVVR